MIRQADYRWLSVAVGLATLVAASVGSTPPASPALLGRDLGAELTPLEDRVGRNPDDAESLEQLADTYLEHSAPGLAQAALDRAPNHVKHNPVIADARARSLTALGRTQVALEVQRGMLTRCGEVGCSRKLLARAQRREQVLAEMNRLGVDDPREEPELALAAYRRSVREVRLDAR